MNLLDNLRDENGAIEVFKATIQVGDVFYVEFDIEDGIHPHDGYSTRKKYFVILGMDEDCIYGGIVINSEINRNLSHKISEYQIIISSDKYEFLDYNSYLDCTRIFPASIEKLMHGDRVGSIDNIDVCYAREKISRAPSITKAQRNRYHI